MDNNQNTPFSAVYKVFFSLITDDMFMELNREQTEAACQDYLEAAIQLFEFPRQDLTDYDEESGCFNISLTKEEASRLPLIMRFGTDGLEEDDELVEIAKGIEEKVKMAQIKETLGRKTRMLNSNKALRELLK